MSNAIEDARVAEETKGILGISSWSNDAVLVEETFEDDSLLGMRSGTGVA